MEISPNGFFAKPDLWGLLPEGTVTGVCPGDRDTALEGQSGKSWGLGGQAHYDSPAATSSSCHPKGDWLGDRGVVNPYPTKKQAVPSPVRGVLPHSGLHLILKQPWRKAFLSPLNRVQIESREGKGLVQSYTAWKQQNQRLNPDLSGPKPRFFSVVLQHLSGSLRFTVSCWMCQQPHGLCPRCGGWATGRAAWLPGNYAAD